MLLRKKAKIAYREEVEIIDSTSCWKKQTSDLLKIETIDCSWHDMFNEASIKGEHILLPQWQNGKWLIDVDIDTLDVPNIVKTLIAKIQYVYIAHHQKIREVYIDGFMDTMLHILGFDDYPCLLYPQYEYFADIGEDEHHIVAKPDFGILSHNHQMLIVIEDKTMDNAKYSNNWKEDQVLGELFVAAHDTVQNHENVHYPINIYAIRVIGTLFTFYKTTVNKEYIKETLRGFPKKNSMKVQRHPHVIDEFKLTAYDICDSNDRKQILKCMSSIKDFLV